MKNRVVDLCQQKYLWYLRYYRAYIHNILEDFFLANRLMCHSFVTYQKYRVALKNVRTLHNNNGAYTLRRKIFFCTFVHQYALLLAYKFQ